MDPLYDEGEVHNFFPKYHQQPFRFEASFFAQVVRRRALDPRCGVAGRQAVLEPPQQQLLQLCAGSKQHCCLSKGQA